MGRQTPDRAAQAALMLGRWALWLRTRIQMRRLLRRRRRGRVSLAVSRGGRRPRCPGLQGGRPDCREPARPGAGTLPLCLGPGQLRPEARGTAQRVWRTACSLCPARRGQRPPWRPASQGAPPSRSARHRVPRGSGEVGAGSRHTQGEQYLPASPRGLRGARGARGRPRPTGSEPPLAPGRVVWAPCAAGSLAALSDSRMVAPRDLGV